MKESARQKPELENILKTKNIDYNTRGNDFHEQSTEPDIGPPFISQSHSNKFAENKHAETGSLFQHVITIELMFAGINMFLARLRLILARAQRGLK